MNQVIRLWKQFMQKRDWQETVFLEYVHMTDVFSGWDLLYFELS